MMARAGKLALALQLSLSMYPIFCFTSDKREAALRVFVHQLKKYWPEHPPVMIAGFTPPQFTLPFDISFYSIGDFADYPIEEWSTAIIKFLEAQSVSHFIWMQEDLWLLRQVDTEAVTKISWLLRNRPEIGRFCLTRDRANNKDALPAGYLGRIDLVETTNEVMYNFSFQCSIWRRDTMLACLAPHESPWQAELAGQSRLAQTGKQVLGTRQCPIKYLIAYQRGLFCLDGGYQTPEFALSKQDIDELALHGILPND